MIVATIFVLAVLAAYLGLLALARDGAYRKAMAEANRAQRLAKQRGEYATELLATLIAVQNRIAAERVNWNTPIVKTTLYASPATPPWERQED